MEFKDRLKELRALKGLSQVELAEKLGVSKSLIGAYETGDRNPGYENLEEIADYFNVSMDYLTGKDSRSMYYLDPEVAEKAQEIYEDPNTRILLDAKRDLSPDDLDYLIQTINYLKKKEGK